MSDSPELPFAESPAPRSDGNSHQPATATESIASPLRVIARFIALSETLATAGAAATDGAARLLLTSFAVGFPLIVLTVFVWLLVRHPANLYAPMEYTAETSVDIFVSALDRRRRAFEVVLSEAVPEAVGAALPSAPSEDFRVGFAAAFDRAFRNRAVTILTEAFGYGHPTRVPVTKETTVQDLLDLTYFSLEPAVEPYTYGRSWVLAREDGKRLPDLEQGPSGMRNDRRRLGEVGISPGETLWAIPA